MPIPTALTGLDVLLRSLQNVGAKGQQGLRLPTPTLGAQQSAQGQTAGPSPSGESQGGGELQDAIIQALQGLASGGAGQLQPTDFAIPRRDLSGAPEAIGSTGPFKRLDDLQQGQTDKLLEGNKTAAAARAGDLSRAQDELALLRLSNLYAQESGALGSQSPTTGLQLPTSTVQTPEVVQPEVAQPSSIFSSVATPRPPVEGVPDLLARPTTNVPNLLARPVESLLDQANAPLVTENSTNFIGPINQASDLSAQQRLELVDMINQLGLIRRDTQAVQPEVSTEGLLGDFDRGRVGGFQANQDVINALRAMVGLK